MKVGLVYPQTEYGDDPSAVKDYAQTAEQLGFNHILAYEHVLGANPIREGGFSGFYTYKDPFLSPFLLFSFMAGITQQIKFTTGVVILPQRQTALVAKQAATLDVLSGGRLRLGIGVGWNHVEYLALNEDFHTRGRRVEEQIQLMRQLWTQPLVEFKGRWHNIPDAGLNPLPVQRPIPIWIGGYAEVVLQRMAKLADGWMPMVKDAREAQIMLDRIDGYLESAGRSRSDIGIEARISFADANPDTWINSLKSWETIGATHISFNTMNSGLNTPGDHLAAIQKFSSVLSSL